MKVACIYIDKKRIAEKLGVNEGEFVFGDIKGDSSEIEFKVFIDSNTEVNGAIEVEVNKDFNSWNVRRQHLPRDKYAPTEGVAYKFYYGDGQVAVFKGTEEEAVKLFNEESVSNEVYLVKEEVLGFKK